MCVFKTPGSQFVRVKNSHNPPLKRRGFRKFDINDENLTWSELLEASFGMLDQERALAEEF